MKIPQTRKQLAAIAAILAAGSVLALLILFAAPGNGDTPAAAPPAPLPVPQAAEAAKVAVQLSDSQIALAGITILQAAPAAIHSILTLPGEIRFNEDRTAQVVPQLAGTVQAVQAQLGQAVSKGQVLALIASSELAEQRSQLLTAERRLAAARATLAREHSLWVEKISAEQDYLQARQAMQEAEIEHNNAEQKLRALGASRGSAASLNSYALRAPFDGVVVEKHLSLGQAVKTDSALFTVSDLNSLWAEIAVPASALARVRVGAPATVKASAADARLSGKISYIGALLGAQTRAATARIVLAGAGAAWRPGMVVDVEVDVDADAEAEADDKGRALVLAVDSRAVQTVAGKPTVFVRTAGGFVARPITPGRADGRHVEVLRGLATGEAYAAAGSFVIKAELGKPGDGDAD